VNEKASCTHRVWQSLSALRLPRHVPAHVQPRAIAAAMVDVANHRQVVGNADDGVGHEAATGRHRHRSSHRECASAHPHVAAHDEVRIHLRTLAVDLEPPSQRDLQLVDTNRSCPDHQKPTGDGTHPRQPCPRWNRDDRCARLVRCHTRVVTGRLDHQVAEIARRAVVKRA
jgi:hypothetical protein